jgi:predicted branched-subunit amino acid permease
MTTRVRLLRVGVMTVLVFAGGAAMVASGLLHHTMIVDVAYGSAMWGAGYWAGTRS